jgi:hypothetical protein
MVKESRGNLGRWLDENRRRCGKKNIIPPEMIRRKLRK